MAQRHRARRHAGSQAGQPELETGELIDDFVRKAQSRPDANSVRANLTDKGSWIHGIEQGTELSILVFSEGIWITPMEGSDGGD